MRAADLARLITDYINSKGNSVSPKKLQKLVYYVDAWHLVHFDRPLIEEDFEAWVHGPVVPSLYHQLKSHGWNNIEIINDELDDAAGRIANIARNSGLTDDQIELIETVLDQYGSLSSFQLELLSHSEAPWQEARGNLGPADRCTTVIPKGRMKEFYRAQLQKSGKTAA